MHHPLPVTNIAIIARNQGRRFHLNRHDIDDLCQNVFLHCIRWADANGSPPSDPLVACIAKRRCAEMHHQRARMPTLTDCAHPDEVDIPTSIESDPAVLAAARERDIRVRAAVRALRPNYREAIERKYLRHHSDRKIAVDCGQNVATIRNWLKRGVRQLRAAVKA
jgi:RNA polymerase sigma factor (sigma-70 family)